MSLSHATEGDGKGFVGEGWHWRRCNRTDPCAEVSLVESSLSCTLNVHSECFAASAGVMGHGIRGLKQGDTHFLKPHKDHDLLARLNALKPSHVSFEAASKAPLVEVETTRPTSTEDRLADRLRSLRSGISVSGPSTTPAVQQTKAEALTSKVRDEVATEFDPVRDWQQQGDGEDPSLDELLAELANDSAEWTLDPEDPKNINALMQEARRVLPARNEAEVAESSDESAQVRNLGDVSEPVDDERNEDQQDEDDADDYVKKVLAELDMEKKYGGAQADDHEDPEAKDSTKDAGPDGPAVDLPPTPSGDLHSPPSYEDSELEARFSKLGLDLPSTPTTTPSSKPQTRANLHTKEKTNLPVHTDEDIDSWCCICNEDGEVRCLGCDGDIYCQQCWREGHGNQPGQERGHRAVQYMPCSSSGIFEGRFACGLALYPLLEIAFKAIATEILGFLASTTKDHTCCYTSHRNHPGPTQDFYPTRRPPSDPFGRCKLAAASHRFFPTTTSQTHRRSRILEVSKALSKRSHTTAHRSTDQHGSEDRMSSDFLGDRARPCRYQVGVRSGKFSLDE
nr:abscission/nocut checkpoint regulator [Quercus suber]